MDLEQTGLEDELVQGLTPLFSLTQRVRRSRTNAYREEAINRMYY
jgi:hypothetical protein